MSRAGHTWLYAFFGVWERFDTLWYVRIATHGYDGPIPIVFYPLYPALIRTFSVITHWDLASALLISTVSSFFLFWGAVRLFELDLAPDAAFRAVLIWAAWPDAFTFFAGYADSLLLAFTIWAIYFGRSRRWGWAGALGLLAGVTKALGCFTALPLLWIGWRYRDGKSVLAALMCGAGTVGFQAWLALNHFPSVAEVYRRYWGTTTVAPWTTLSGAMRSIAHGGDALLILNLSVLALTAVPACVYRVRIEYRIYAVAAVCLFLTKHTEPLLQSTMRYSLSVFAAYPALSSRLRGLAFASAVLIAFALNLFLFRVFLDWGLVA